MAACAYVYIHGRVLACVRVPLFECARAHKYMDKYENVCVCPCFSAHAHMCANVIHVKAHIFWNYLGQYGS